MPCLNWLYLVIRGPFIVFWVSYERREIVVFNDKFLKKVFLLYQDFHIAKCLALHLFVLLS